MFLRRARTGRPSRGTVSERSRPCIDAFLLQVSEDLADRFPLMEWEEATLWIPPRKRESQLPEILSREEVQRIVCTPTNPKHRTLLMKTYAAGLRVNEVVNLCVEDIESDRMVIRVRSGKRRKDRYTILSKRLLVELRKYWKIDRPPVCLLPGSDPGKPMERGTVQTIYRKARKKAGITKTCFRRLIDKLWEQEWVVYCKPPIAGPQQVLEEENPREITRNPTLS